MVELVGQDTPARDGLDVLAGLSSVAVDVIGRSFEFPFGYVFSFSFDKIKLVNLPCLLSSCHVIDALLRVWLLSSRIVGWGNDFLS